MSTVLPIRNIPAAEQQAIVKALIERLNERISRRFAFQVEFTVIDIQNDCRRVRLGLALTLSDTQDAAATIVAQYTDFMEGAKQLWGELNEALEYITEGHTCTARYANARLTERLYGPVAEGHTLPQIACQLDCGQNTQEQAMLAIFEANRESFIDNNLHLIKRGSVLAIPDQAAIAEIPLQRANMQVMKHRRRFETRKV
ncbi:MAG: FimV/HubP family polar landmark protein [Chromatiales bacterium]|jgi:FimV-like protein